MKLLRILESGAIKLSGFGGKNSMAAQYIELFQDFSDPPPPGRNGFMLGDVIVELDKRGEDTVSITNIQSLSRGEGQSSRALRELTKQADELGITLVLYATQYTNRGMTTEQLVKWYERNGFVPDSRYHPGKRGVDMVRVPN